MLVILDRDGVINEDSDDYIKSVDEWIPLPGAIDAIAKLSNAGFDVVVATNQSGLGRGLFTLDDLEAMHQKLVGLVEERGGRIAGIFYCPHRPEDECDCRKPKPGMIDAIRDVMGEDVSGCPIVGDSLRDLQAGVARGCKPILVQTGKGAQTLTKLSGDPISSLTVVVADLAAAADHIINLYT
jgi:D-glycero-D-manno-heptose 1,7-bisphosphate phosphatase